MNEASPTRRHGPSAEQLRYARILDYGMKAGLAALIAGFFAYASGILPALVPFEALPRLWTLPVEDYLRESGMAAGWGWLTILGKGDVLVLVGIAVLSGISVPCLIVLIPAYARSRDWWYLIVTVMLIGVLILAASGALIVH